MGLVAIIAVLLSGMAINNENAVRPVNNFSDFKHAVEVTIEDVKSRDKFVSHKLND